MFDDISDYGTICLNGDHDQFEHSRCLQHYPFVKDNSIIRDNYALRSVSLELSHYG